MYIDQEEAECARQPGASMHDTRRHGPGCTQRARGREPGGAGGSGGAWHGGARKARRRVAASWCAMSNRPRGAAVRRRGRAGGPKGGHVMAWAERGRGPASRWEESRSQRAAAILMQGDRSGVMPAMEARLHQGAEASGLPRGRQGPLELVRRDVMNHGARGRWGFEPVSGSG